MLEEVDNFLFRKWVKTVEDIEKGELPSILHDSHWGMYINDFPLMIWKIPEGI
jgi:hypothetical protein